MASGNHWYVNTDIWNSLDVSISNIASTATAAYAYSDLVSRAVTLHKLNGARPLKPTDIFAITIRYYSDDPQTLEKGNHYVASLVTTNLESPVIVHEVNSSTSFEKALKWLFAKVSLDQDHGMSRLEHYSHAPSM